MNQTQSHHEALVVAAQLNVQGVSSLLLGQDSKAAFPCFRRALTAIEGYLNDDPAVHQAQDTTAVEEGPPGNPAPQQVPWSAVTIHDMEDPAFYISNQAMMCVEDPALGGRSSLHLASLYILYNLGLSFHRYGLKHGDNNKLISAYGLYKACIDIVRAYPFEDKDQDMVKTVALFCMNNQAHILYRCLGQQDRALEILGYMESHISSFDCPAPEGIIEEIVKNTILIPASPLRAAPAA